MEITGPGLAGSDAAQAFLADMAARPADALAGVTNALERLTELPMQHDWLPLDEAGVSAVMQVYTRGLVASGLIVDWPGDSGEELLVPYVADGAQVAFLEQEPSLGLLVRVSDAMVSANMVHRILAHAGRFHPYDREHRQAFSRLVTAHRNVVRRKLAAQKGEGQ